MPGMSRMCPNGGLGILACLWPALGMLKVSSGLVPEVGLYNSLYKKNAAHTPL